MLVDDIIELIKFWPFKSKNFAIVPRFDIVTADMAANLSIFSTYLFETKRALRRDYDPMDCTR